ncbi:type I DNA topoisomerase [Candidatus Peregrinibacteria bacterium]|nr:type I DNA topoisomerase [Candidatus Peregrinibacteria bacterium]MBT4056434.1 type I DNA topoisomerase [Candidatus Peregrinibacteria bacterium]
MAKNLVIVESPAKARTITGFLGSDYKVLASMGHVRDLPKSKMGIEIDKDFTPQYEVSDDKKKTITALKKEIGADTKVWVATDEDREGEAIGWHLLAALKVNPEKNPVSRIVFHEITKSAIEKAVASPREIDQNLVDAQQARRILDRLVGYELSPLLWKKVQKGLSAGRVQSVAVRLVVEKEREIRAFKPEEFWKIKGEFSKDKEDDNGYKTFFATMEKDNQKVKLGKEETVEGIMKALEGAAYKIGSVEEKQVKRNPTAPFTTSTLQQEASRKMGFSVKKTMVIAQKLYEGSDVGTEKKGLITYMRTDSVNLADQALEQARSVVTERFGAEFALSEPRKYKGKKGAQEAHEAIRPTDLSLHPDDAKGFLDKDMGRLYELIWKRTIASQMAQAILNKVVVEVLPEGGDRGVLEGCKFVARGQTVEFAGFMKVYTEGRDEDSKDEDGAEDGAGDGAEGGAAAEGVGAKPEAREGTEKDIILPVLAEGEEVEKLGLEPSQHFTKPPARYTEASLVKKLESEGIGRPSTYAPTISTIQTRKYVEKNGKHLIPTDVGEVVTDFLVKHFGDVIDYKFTASMEEELDEIADGKKEWVPVIKEFYAPFHDTIVDKTESVNKADVVNEETDEVCEKCDKPMVIKLGRFGKFLSCSGYPECKNAKPLDPSGEGGAAKPVDEELEKLQEEHKGKKCEKCGADMTVRKGRFGPFLGCSAYPKCKTIVGLDGSTNDTGIKCPACKDANLIKKRTRRGKEFWGCGGYPKCKFASWDKPLRAGKNDAGVDGVIVEKKGEEVCVVPEE